MSGPSRQTIAVIVPTFRNPTGLRRTVEALLAQQTDRRYEVLVVDDGSGDGTATALGDLVTTHGGLLRLSALPTNRGAAAARNHGLGETSADVVLFTDDDCEPGPTWVARMGDALARFDVAQGRTVPRPQEAPLGPLDHTVSTEGETGFYETCNVGYRRAVLERCGGFDEGYGSYGEDVDLAWRAKQSGATTTFVPAAVVVHDVRDRRSRSIRRDLARQASVPRLVRAHPGLRSRLHRRLFTRPTHPAAAVAAAGLAAAVAARRWWPAVALAGPYAWQVTARPSRGIRPATPGEVPVQLAFDVAEIAVLAYASLRHRTPVL